MTNQSLKWSLSGTASPFYLIKQQSSPATAGVNKIQPLGKSHRETLGPHSSLSLKRRHRKVTLSTRSRTATYRSDYRACRSSKRAGSQSSRATRGLSSGEKTTLAHLSTQEKRKKSGQERLGVGEVGLPDQLAPRRLPSANRERAANPGGSRAAGCSRRPRFGPAPGSLQGLARSREATQPTDKRRSRLEKSHVGGRERGGGGHPAHPPR